jgi:hypothetical protein
VGREFRRHLLLDRAEGVVAVRADEIEKQALHAAEQFTASFERDEGVLESRLGRVGRDCLHLAQVLRHALRESGRVVLVAHAVESRIAEGQGAWGEERVGYLGGGGGGG